MNKAEGLIQALRHHFVNFGAPEILASDGGPEYSSTETQAFLQRWKVIHRLSSAYNPRSNLRADLGVKTIKRLLRENTGRQGSLDTDKMGRALLTYRNTPNKDLGLSPAQMMFGRNLRDHLPATLKGLKQHREWIMMKEDREKALSVKFGKMGENLERGTKQLKELEPGDVVQVQNQRGKDPLRWDKSGTVVEKGAFGQYSVRMDGSGRVTLRNRKFLRKIIPRFGRQDVLVEQDEDNWNRNGSEQTQRIRKEPDRFQSEW